MLVFETFSLQQRRAAKQMIDAFEGLSADEARLALDYASETLTRQAHFQYQDPQWYACERAHFIRLGLGADLAPTLAAHGDTFQRVSGSQAQAQNCVASLA